MYRTFPQTRQRWMGHSGRFQRDLVAHNSVGLSWQVFAEPLSAYVQRSFADLCRWLL